MTPRRLIFSKAADADLEEIGDYIASGNPHRAVSFLQELRNRCRAIAYGPTTYPSRDNMAPGLRMAVHGRYHIYYRNVPDQDLVRIERILHGARDAKRLLTEWRHPRRAPSPAVLRSATRAHIIEAMNREETVSVAVTASVASRLQDAAREGAYPTVSDLLGGLLDEWELSHDGNGWDPDELRQLAQEGVDSGPARDADEVFAELRAEFCQAPVIVRGA